jgi:hypothetical protein
MDVPGGYKSRTNFPQGVGGLLGHEADPPSTLTTTLSLFLEACCIEVVDGFLYIALASQTSLIASTTYPGEEPEVTKYCRSVAENSKI